jgi:hypothetical protein
MAPENKIPADISQPSLFDLGESSTGIIEFFPQLWGIADMLVSSDTTGKREALAQLEEIDAARFSPLVAYLLTTFLDDSDLELRTVVVRILGRVLGLDQDSRPAPDNVRQCLYQALSQMRTRRVYALLQVSRENGDLEPEVARLLNVCSYAGTHLADIGVSRKNPIVIRREAIKFIGRVGYLDALTTLERLSARLEARQNGQQALPFAPHGDEDEADLLPELRSALRVLRSP